MMAVTVIERWPQPPAPQPAILTGVPAKPLIKDSVGEGVQEDEDGIVGGQVGLPSGAVQEEVGQVVQASHYGVVVTLWVAVACHR